jgi:rod shape determining protein RodA
MLEYAGSQRSGLRSERDAPHLLAVVRSLDWVLLAGIVALVVVGLWGVAGVTKFAVPGDPSYYLNRQILYACVGAVVLVAAALVDPDLYRRYWRAIFVGTAVVIAFVLLVGSAAHGSTRWINLGFFTFQPSEFGKLLFVLALAGMLAERQRLVGTWDTTLKVVGIGLIPVVLVFIQPDLGTALVYMAALGAMLFIAGIPWRHLAVLGGLVVLIAVGVL